MTSLLSTSSSRARVQPTLIPARAAPHWLALVAALKGRTPPCSTDPPAWFALDPVPAIEACGFCPAAVECLAYATAAHEAAGVWGGVQFPRTRSHRAMVTPTP